MFYLSITFILSGLFVLAYSLFKGFSDRLSNIENGRDIKTDDNSFIIKRKKNIEGDAFYAAGKAADSDEKHSRISRVFNNDGEDEGNDIDDFAEIKYKNDNDRTGSASASPDAETSYAYDETNEVVLFNDNSRTFEHYAESGDINPSLEMYSKINRVGKGNLDVENNGINFFIDKKLFRFDFHRIEKINRGGNFIALSIRGSNSVKLFVFLNGKDMIDNLAKQYSEFIA